MWHFLCPVLCPTLKSFFKFHSLILFNTVQHFSSFFFWQFVAKTLSRTKNLFANLIEMLLWLFFCKRSRFCHSPKWENKVCVCVCVGGGVCDTNGNKSKYSLRHDLFIALCKLANSSGKLFRSISQRRLESYESHLWKSSLMKCSLKLLYFGMKREWTQLSKDLPTALSCGGKKESKRKWKETERARQREKIKALPKPSGSSQDTQGLLLCY